MKKRILIIRCGAYGDMLIVSPLFKALKQQGWHVILNTGTRGMEVLKNNPHIDELILYEHENKDNPEIEQYWEDLEKKIAPDKCINFAESLEVNISLHPRSPAYNYPKWERFKRGNRNFYEECAKWANVEFEQYRPDLYLSNADILNINKYIKTDKFNILWALSGSGSNKVYPWTDYVMGEILKNNNNVHFITVGDEKCQILEDMIDDENITNLAGRISFRDSMALTSMVDLVVSPDTGILHASGAFDTPKIGILGHTTIENVTKHFINDYTLEADQNLCECSPCFRLIYNHKIQCPVDKLSMAAWCMHHGQPKERLYNRIMEVVNAGRSTKNNGQNEIMSDMHQTVNIST